MKDSPDKKSNNNLMKLIRIYFLGLLIMHRNMGAFRIISAYCFAIFALICLFFTVKVPVAKDFLPPTKWALIESRMITIGMMIANIIVYSVIFNWKRKKGVRALAVASHKSSMVMRFAFIGMVLYLDVLIIGRTVYEIARFGAFFY